MARHEVPERGALVIGHLYPRTFGWVIKTGSAVDREALAGAVDLVNRSEVRLDAASTLRTHLLATDYAGYAHLEGLIKATVGALKRPKGVNHGNRVPKSKERIQAEALVIEVILRAAMRVLRRS